MLQREIPFLRICVALCAGIISGLYLKPAFLLPWIFFIIIITLLIISVKFPAYPGISAFGILALIAFLLAGNILYTVEKNSLTSLKNVPSVYRCILDDYPQVKPSTLMMTLKLEDALSPGSSGKIRGSVLIYHRDKEYLSSFTPGDILYIRLTPEEIRNRGNPYEFDYRFYMENLGIKYLSFTEKDDLIRHVKPGKRNLRHRALVVRHRIIEMYSERGITPERLPLVAAITLGEKRMLEPDTKENFMKAGIMHIMAVSGLHAVILSMFIFNALFFLKGRLTVLRIIITILLLWAFAYITGLTPSVLRATIMYSFLQTGKLLHRRVNGTNSVLASAFVLILARPSVIFDAGFLLSYSAVIFIIEFYSKFNRLITLRNKILSLSWQSVSVTVIAQAGTLPLTLLFFNRFPPYFIFTNLIIVPVSSIIVILGCIIPVIYPLKTVSTVTGLLLDRLTWFTEEMTAKAASLPGSSIENLGMTVTECILLAAMLFSITCFLLQQKKKIVVPLLFIFLYLSSSAIKHLTTSTSGELVVYNTSGSPGIGIRTGHDLFLYTDTAMLPPEVKRHCASLNLKPVLVEKSYPLVLSTGNTSIMISNSPSRDAGLFPDVDLVIVDGNYNPAALRILNDSCIVIVTGNISRHSGRHDDKKLYSVKESGAYIKNL